MIPISSNFSLTRRTVNFIYGQAEAAGGNKCTRFCRRELVTRIAALSLSALALLDFCIHALAATNAAFYALYKGAITRRRPDFSRAGLHGKCLKQFVPQILTASISCFFDPKPSTFACIEDPRALSVRGLLLSRDPKLYTKNDHIDSLDLCHYVRTMAECMPSREKRGMQETLELLKGAEEVLEGAKNVLRKKQKELETMPPGKSILIPISFATPKQVLGGSRHIVYCLIRKEEDDNFTVNIINKGWGCYIAAKVSDKCISWGPDWKLRKQPVNFCVKSASLQAVKTYMADLFELKEKRYSISCNSSDNHIMAKLLGMKVNDKGEFSECVLGKPSKEDTLMCKLQVSGDCPKASLLGALYYHSAFKGNGTPFNPLPYKKFLSHLKRRALQQDGHLLDIMLSLPASKTPPSEVAKERLEKRCRS